MVKIERTILGTLVLDTALHIGAGKGGDPTDSPLRRSGDGRFFIPGRAIAGSLRTTATRLAPRLGYKTCKALEASPDGKPCLCLACQLFGELYPGENDAETKGGAASRIWISDAFAEAEKPPTYIRDGVGIGRSNSAAACAIKFDYEVAARGAQFPLRLRLVENDSPEADQRTQLLSAVLAEWQAGRGRLGGNVARGLGRFHLQDLRCVKTQLGSSDELLAYLLSDYPWQVALEDNRWLANALAASQRAQKFPQSIKSAAGGFVTAEFKIKMGGPFLINDPLTAILSGFDHAPLVELAFQDGMAGKPVLSGSSLRGALRSRAEKILRTLATIHWSTRDDFLTHCPACDPLESNVQWPLASCDRRVDFHQNDETPEEALCLSCQLFGSPRRGSRLWVEDAHWVGPRLDGNAWKAQDFLAIDHFTGGGQEHAKFDAAPLIGAQFVARLTLNAPQAWELGCLILLLRDLAEGELTIGFGAAKGYGKAQAVDFHWQIGVITPDDFPGDAALLTDFNLSGIYQVTNRELKKGQWLPGDWQGQAEQWLIDFHEAVKAFSGHAKSSPLQDDTFFTTDGLVSHLYGLPRVEVER